MSVTGVFDHTLPAIIVVFGVKGRSFCGTPKDESLLCWGFSPDLFQAIWIVRVVVWENSFVFGEKNTETYRMGGGARTEWMKRDCFCSILIQKALREIGSSIHLLSFFWCICSRFYDLWSEEISRERNIEHLVSKLFFTFRHCPRDVEFAEYTIPVFVGLAWKLLAAPLCVVSCWKQNCLVVLQFTAVQLQPSKNGKLSVRRDQHMLPSVFARPRYAAQPEHLASCTLNT